MDATKEVREAVEAAAKSIGLAPATVAREVGLGGDFFNRLDAGAEVRVKTRNKVMPRINAFLNAKTVAE